MEILQFFLSRVYWQLFPSFQYSHQFIWTIQIEAKVSKAYIFKIIMFEYYQFGRFKM